MTAESVKNTCNGDFGLYSVDGITSQGQSISTSYNSLTFPAPKTVVVSGTTLVFDVKPYRYVDPTLGVICTGSDTFLSTDSTRARITTGQDMLPQCHPENSGPNVWCIAWEDWTDGDFTDLVVRVEAVQTELAPVAELSDGQVAASASSDPVSTLTGQYMYRRTDVAIPGRGPSPAFARAYSSADTRLSPLGPGWTHNYAMHLANPGDPSHPKDVLLVNPQGRSDRYTFSVLNPDGSATYTSPHAVYATLLRNADGTFTAVQLDQTTWGFSANGQLLRITDRYGNQSTLTYNAKSQLVSISDPAGRGSLVLGYDPTSGRLTSVTDWQTPTARVVSYNYDGSGRLWHVTDRNSKQTTFGYDGTSQRLTTITDANGHVAVTMSYDAATGKVLTQKDAKNSLTSFAYGASTTTVTYPTTSFDGFAPQQIDSYDAQGRLTQSTRKPSASETFNQQYGYDANWNTTSATDARGNTTSTCFDAAGNVTRISRPAALDAKTNTTYRPVTYFQYDAKNNLVRTVPPEGMGAASTNCTVDISATAAASLYRTDIAYSDPTKPQTVTTTQRFTDPNLGQQTATTTSTFDTSTSGGNPGRLLQTTSARNNSTTFAYATSGSQAGMLQSVTGPPVPENAAGNTVTYAYDAVGRRTSMVDAIGNAGGSGDHTWAYTYDHEDRPTAIQAPAPIGSGAKLTSTLHYDAVGNRDWVQDANGQYTRSVYDVRDSLLQQLQSATASDPNSDPSKIVTQYTYDNLGNLQRVLRAAGDSANERATDYAYDDLNRVRKETQYPSWPTTSPTLVTQYSYDANGNRTSLTKPDATTITSTFDVLNRQTSVSNPSVTYSYDANSNRYRMNDVTGQTTYTYDELNRPASVASPGPNTVGYRYDVDGNRTKVIYADSTAVTYSFDNADRLQSLQDWASRTTSYQYFPDGLVKTATNVNTTTAQYTYDNARRLTQVLNQLGSSTISQDTYTLDAAGNRTQMAEALGQLPLLWPATFNLTYSYDHLYRLTSDGTNTYTYDPVGNLTGPPGGLAQYDRSDRNTRTARFQQDSNGNVIGADTFVYDAANDMTQGTVANVNVTYTYDGDGKRASRQVTGGGGSYTLVHVYDVNRQLPVVLQDQASGTRPPPSRKYVWGATGLAYAVSGSGAGTPLVYHADGLGSVRVLTDGSGTIVQTYRTDAFGNPDATYTQGSVAQRFQYAGEERDEDGIIFLRARYYNPQIGRFMSRDPLPKSGPGVTGWNRYAYAGNNPVSAVDPTGLSTSHVLGDHNTTSPVSGGGRYYAPFQAAQSNSDSWCLPTIFGMPVCIGNPADQASDTDTLQVRLNSMTVQLQASPSGGGGTTTNIASQSIQALATVGVTSQAVNGLLAYFYFVYVPSGGGAGAANAVSNAIDGVNSWVQRGGVPDTTAGQTVVRETFLIGRQIWRFEVVNYYGHTCASEKGTLWILVRTYLV